MLGVCEEMADTWRISSVSATFRSLSPNKEHKGRNISLPTFFLVFLCIPSCSLILVAPVFEFLCLLPTGNYAEVLLA